VQDGTVVRPSEAIPTETRRPARRADPTTALRSLENCNDMLCGEPSWRRTISRGINGPSVSFCSMGDAIQVPLYVLIRNEPRKMRSKSGKNPRLFWGVIARQERLQPQKAYFDE
jgi:hypothetical protein